MARDLQQHLASALADDYRIERELGAGATAKVYLAHDLKHDRLVALKVLRPELALAVGAERFLREIQTAARLSHPGIMPLYDSGEIDGLLYFTMPYVEGESLRHRLDRNGRLPVADAVRITREVAAALAHAHASGVIHRDVKPENILVAGDHPLVADFGIALALEESGDERLTHTGMVVGTPQYMSPEQSSGAPLDQRSDVYSLACVLYEMLSGRAPFVGATLHAIAAQRRAERPASIETLRPDVPAAVASTLDEALSVEPSERFATMTAFADALVDPKRKRRRYTRGQLAHARKLGAISLGLVALAVAGVFVARGTRRAPLRERDWVLVADFDGPPSDPGLGRVVRELVTTELNQSRYLSTMPRGALTGALRASGYADSTKVNVDVARELALRSAVRAAVVGGVTTNASGYTLTLRAVDVADGHALATASVDAAPDSIVPAVQRVARALRGQLGERRDDLLANQLLLDIATPSFPAYRKYVDALARKESGNIAASTHMLREAVTLDTGFAAAWALMGLNYVESRNLDSARLMFQEALRRPNRMNTAQAYRLRGDAAYALDRDVPGALRWYDEYLKRTPRSIGGHNNRGLYLSMLGRYDEALGEFEKAASNNPFGPDQSAIINTTDMLVALGRVDRATARARDITGPYAQYSAMRLATVASRWTTADSIARRAIAASGTSAGVLLEATMMHASALAARGAVAEADRTLADAASLASGAQSRWYENARSLLALTTGLPVPNASAALTSDTTPGGMVARGIRLALRGDTTAARAMLTRLSALPPAPRARLGAGAEVIDALIATAAHRWDDVIAIVGPASRAGEHDAADVDRVPSVMTRFIVANAYGQLGRLDSAVATMQRAVAYTSVPPGHLSLRGFAYPAGERRIAQWSALRGDAALSKQAWSDFAAVFTTPDLSLRAWRDEVPSVQPSAPSPPAATRRPASPAPR